jgi:hypothetical protein
VNHEERKKKTKKPDQDSMTVRAKPAQHTKQASKLGDTGPAKKHVRTPEIFQTGKAKKMESEERADTQNVHMSTHFAVNKWYRPLDGKMHKLSDSNASHDGCKRQKQQRGEYSEEGKTINHFCNPGLAGLGGRSNLPGGFRDGY